MLEEAKYSINLDQVMDYDFVTAAHVACSVNNVEILKFLLDHGVDCLNPKDRWGKTPLDRARMEGNEEAVRILEEALQEAKL